MPEIGSSNTYQVKFKICIKCNCIIGDTGLCSYGCEHDGHYRGPGETILRIYERTDVLQKEEVI